MGYTYVHVILLVLYKQFLSQSAARRPFELYLLCSVFEILDRYKFKMFCHTYALIDMLDILGIRQTKPQIVAQSLWEVYRMDILLW